MDQPASRRRFLRHLAASPLGYVATGIDDEVTLRANREGFQKFQLLPRRLVGAPTSAPARSAMAWGWRAS